MPELKSSLSTRSRILVYLAEHHHASANGLSRAWGLTRADIRHHLNRMAADGEIELAPKAPGGAPHPGRPEQFYRLSPQSHPNSLPVLCGALIDALEVRSGEGDETAFRMVANLLPVPPPAQKPNVIKLGDAVAQLNRLGYRANWEAGPTGPRVLLRCCPYAAVAPAHPQVCMIDRYYLERLTGLSLAHITRMNPETGRPSACIFASRPGA